MGIDLSQDLTQQIGALHACVKSNEDKYKHINISEITKPVLSVMTTCGKSVTISEVELAVNKLGLKQPFEWRKERGQVLAKATVRDSDPLISNIR